MGDNSKNGGLNPKNSKFGQAKAKNLIGFQINKAAHAHTNVRYTIIFTEKNTFL
jgi:hypothetical protein